MSIVKYSIAFHCLYQCFILQSSICQFKPNLANSEILKGKTFIYVFWLPIWTMYRNLVIIKYFKQYYRIWIFFCQKKYWICNRKFPSSNWFIRSCYNTFIKHKKWTPSLGDSHPQLPMIFNCCSCILIVPIFTIKIVPISSYHF
jgi:hypothetical protein